MKTVTCRVLNVKLSQAFLGLSVARPAVWTATIARVSVFCSVIQNVHDYATDLRTSYQNVANSVYILQNFRSFSQFRYVSTPISRIVSKILEFHRMLRNYMKLVEIYQFRRC